MNVESGDPSSKVEQLLEKYIHTVEEWDSTKIANGVSRANKLFDKALKIASELGSTEPGRRAIESQLDSQNIGVSLLAACEVVAWSPSLAIPKLEELATHSSIRWGRHALAAKYVLIDVRAGRYKLRE